MGNKLNEGSSLPSDWVAVPREPTEAMIEIICDRHAGKSIWPDDYGNPAQAIRRRQARDGYLAMLAAAPSAPAEGGVSAGDAVFAFSAMLTSLPHVIPLGSAAWATPGADLAAAFNEANGLSVSRDFPEGLKFPEIEGKLLDVVKRASEEIKTAPEPLAQGEREDARKFRRIAQLLDGFDFRLGRNALMPPATYLDSVEITCEFQPGVGQTVIDAIVDLLATEKANG